ncbi:MAG TPA: glycosyltransferase [Bryobacteraceae bacterium]|nr:glycosyltransferase [Bryobacteraceae bacterium]
MPIRHRIVMAPWGSFGDIHPYIAVGIGLRKRGHAVTIATCEIYRRKIEGEGMVFAPMRPDVGELMSDPETLRRALDLKHGTEYVVRSLVLPFLEQTYNDLRSAAADADLLVSHPVTYALPLVAETLALPWISVVLGPLGLFSSCDPPVFAPAPGLIRLRPLGRWPYWLFYSLFKAMSRSWGAPIDELRRKIGLASARKHPLVEGAFSPYGTLAWFSREFARPQPDWPGRTEVTGFPFYDRRAPDHETDPALARFLSNGEPPIVFTLGTSAVWHAGDFYEQSLAAVTRLGRRAVLVLGTQCGNHLPGSLPDSVMITEYARFSELFHRAAVNVHHGGIGTTAQALRAGKPMLVVPWSHDQPDNATRVARLGVGRTLYRRDYTARSAFTEIERLLKVPAYASRAAEIGRRIQEEDGVTCACDAIESIAAAARR